MPSAAADNDDDTERELGSFNRPTLLSTSWSKDLGNREDSEEGGACICTYFGRKQMLGIKIFLEPKPLGFLFIFD